MSSPSSAAPSSWKTFAWRCLPWLPALITLGVIETLRLGVPVNDSWWFIESYRDWLQGNYGWRDLFATHGPHPTVPGKLIYWFALHVMKGDIGWLPVLSWLFSLGIALGCRSLLKVQFADSERTQRWLLLLANTIIFSPVQGSTWLWDFLYQNFIAGMCLMGALRCLSRSNTSIWNILCAGGLATVAALSFGSGFTIAWLLLPLLWWRLRQQKRSLAWLAGAVGLALLLTWLALVLLPSFFEGRAHGNTSERVEGVINRPLQTLQYLFVLFGGSLGQGTALDPTDWCMLLGGLATLAVMSSLVIIWRRRRDDAALLADAWPWLACCSFALLSSLMITLARMNNSYNTALTPRYQTFTLFFVLGAVMLIALVTKRGPHRDQSWLKPVVAVFLALQAVNWAYGVQTMRQFHLVLQQNRAALVFAKVLPLDPDRVIQHNGRGSVQKIAIPWHDQDRLRGVQMLEDTRLNQLRVASDMSKNTAHLDFVGRNAAGKVVLQGVCAGSKNYGELPDLILVTAAVPGQEERIIAFQFPFTPPDYFFDSIRSHDIEDHYRGFRVVLDQAPVPTDTGVKLRTYAYFHKRRSVRRISGEFPVP